MMIYIVLAVAVAGAVGAIANRPQLCPAAFFVGRYLLHSFGGQMSVTQKTIFDLVLICGLLLIQMVGRALAKKRVPRARSLSLEKGMFVASALVVFFSVVGYLKGFSVFQIAVDAYKVLEIWFFYILITCSWRNRQELKSGLSALIILMCVLGVVEIPTTARGDVGLFIMMCAGAILFSLGVSGLRKLWMPLMVVTLLTVFLSETRTYLFGFCCSLLLVWFLSDRDGRRRNQVPLLMLIWGASLALFFYVELSDSSVFSDMVGRIAGLAKGFGEAGGYRLDEIRTALSIFLESPVIGSGYGFMRYVFIPKMGFFYWGDFMHNSYAEILMKTGVFGFTVYGTLIAFFIRLLLRGRKDAKSLGDGYAYALASGGVACTVGWLIVYFAAPLSTFGPIFLGGIIAITAIEIMRREKSRSLQVGREV